MKTVTKNQDEEATSIVVIGKSEEETFTGFVNSLLTEYKAVIFVNNDKNFTDDELQKIGLASNDIIFQTSENKCTGYEKRNIFSEFSNLIKNLSEYNIGEKYKFNPTYFEKKDEKIFLYKNNFVKIIKGTRESYFVRLTNYSFNITEIKVNCDDESKIQDLNLEVIDFNGKVDYIHLPAKDKYSLSGFRKTFYPSGAFLDGMSSNDFTQILNRLYEAKNYGTVKQQDQPGLVPSQNVWLFADEVISLEN